MKTPILPVLLAVLTLLALPTSRAADLSDADRQFLRGYETVRSALAADDLGHAKAAAVKLDGAGALAKSDSLDAAREAFKSLSARAVKLAAGQPGFFVLNCPMVKPGDWVQTSDKVSNPYMGKAMLTCGSVVKR